MDGVPAVYLGKLISKVNFRAFIYAFDGVKKLIDSWDDFESHMQSGLWFDSPQERDSAKEVTTEKPKRVRKPVKSGEPIELFEKSDNVKILESSMELIEEELIPVEPEVIDDGFLPKERK